jgi:CRISPR-associated endoribonuclease Cas6
MRLLIRFQLEQTVRLPLDHQEQLVGLVYRLLGESDAEYARFLHDEGYAVKEGGSKRLKLFVFSSLRIPKGRRKVEGAFLRIFPGEVTWLLASPRGDFLTHGATGLFAVGESVQVGPIPLRITGIECLPEPVFQPVMRFTCLTPIVASLPRDDGSTHYLTPSEGPAFSEAVRKNLLMKYTLIHGRPPEDDRLALTFDADYLARSPHGGTKLTTFKKIQIRGAFAPFTLQGSVELMEVGWNCGLGQGNSTGFGMVEVSSKGERKEEAD